MNKLLAFILLSLTLGGNIIGYFTGEISFGEGLIVFMLIGIFINTTTKGN